MKGGARYPWLRSTPNGAEFHRSARNRVRGIPRRLEFLSFDFADNNAELVVEVGRTAGQGDPYRQGVVWCREAVFTTVVGEDMERI